MDLDGVFANFELKVTEILGPNPSELSKSDFWRRLNQVEHFFATLQPIPESIEHFKELRRRSLIPIEILTGLPLPFGNFKTSESDKRVWVEYHLSPHIKVNCTTRRGDKIKYINSPHDILIDDVDYNINGWKNAGGVGILHKNWKDSFDQLNKLGVLS